MRQVLPIVLVLSLALTVYAQSDYSRRPRDSWPSWVAGIPGYSKTPDDGKPFYSTVVYATNLAAWVPDGTTDNSAAWTNTLNNAPNNASIFLPVGPIKITNYIAFNSTKNVEVLGQGSVGGGYQSGKTLLLLSAGVAGGAFANGSPILFGCDATRNTFLVTNGFSRGSSNLVLNSTSGFAVGQMVRFYETNDNPNYILANYKKDLPGGCNNTDGFDWGYFEGNFSFCSNSFTHQGQQFYVTAINANTVTVSAPIYFPFYALSNVPTADFAQNTCQKCGMKNVVISYSGAADYIVTFGFAQQCWWVSNVSSNANHAHIQLEDCANIFVHGNGTLWHQIMDSNAREGIGLDHASDCLVENNYFELGNIAFKSQLTCSGNVFAYNYSHMGWVTNSSNPTIDGSVFCPVDAIHGDNSAYELFEGNVGPQGGSDSFWGGSQNSTFFRNWYARDGWSGLTANIRFNQGSWAFDVDSTNWNFNAIGNVWGTTRDISDANSSHYTALLGFARSSLPVNNIPPASPYDTNVSKTIFYHGNFDYVPYALSWSNGVTHSISNSMYLTQKPTWFGSLPWPIGPDQTRTSSFNANVITNANSISNIFIPAQVLEFYGTNLSPFVINTTSFGAGSRINFGP